MKEFTVEDWIDEIRNALEYRKLYGMEMAWNKLEASYLNDPSSDASMGPNIIFSQGDSLLSDLCVPDPEFVVSPKRREAVDTAPIVQALDNWFVTELQMKKHVERSLLHCYLYGRGIMKIGYDSQWGFDPELDIGGLDQPMGMTLSQFNKKGQAIEFNAIDPGMPWVESVHPRDFVVPWGTVDLESAPWCAQRIVRLNEDIKADMKYKNTRELEPQMAMEEFMESYKDTPKNYRFRNKTEAGYLGAKKRIYNELWEIHDRRHKKVFVICFTHEKFLRDMPDALQIDGLPYCSATFVQSPLTFWTTPQAFYLGQSQKELHDIAIQAAKQRRMSCLKFLMKDGAMDEDEISKALSAEVGIVAKVKTNVDDLRSVFTPFPTHSNIELANEAEYSRRNAREAIGYSRNQGGEFDTSSRRTAFETAKVAEGAEKRTNRRMDVVKALYCGPIRKANQLIFLMWRTPRSIQVMPGEWKQFSGDEIRGDYMYKVNLSTASNLSNAQRQQQALMMMAQMAQYPNVNLQNIEKYIIQASNDPAFEGFFMFPQQTGGAGGASPMMEQQIAGGMQGGNMGAQQQGAINATA